MKNQHLKKYNFYINGMRCNACVFVIENELNNYEGVSGVKVSLDTNSIEVVGDFGNRSLQEIVDFLTIPIKDNGYIISIEPLSYNKKIIRV
jgi:copper chaperone CopZ